MFKSFIYYRARTSDAMITTNPNPPPKIVGHEAPVSGTGIVVGAVVAV